MQLLRLTVLVATLAAGIACTRRPTPVAALPPAARQATPPPLALALLRSALEQDGPRLRVRLPRDGAIAVSPGAEAGTWRFRCRCYTYVPASTLPWVYEATGTIEPGRGLVKLTGLTPPPGLPTALLPSPVAVLPRPGGGRPTRR
ncbi:MAG: hypothetical protein VKQ33_10125 [Candidatus Sericytochromatia bacterium]|nr:hypothetical protein [Candidatus Sericytochromatia bacterium]